MITFELGLDELAATSFACSALLETGMSLRMWTHPGRYAEQVPLFNRMRPAFERLDTELLTALVGSWHWIPDFLTGTRHIDQEQANWINRQSQINSVMPGNPLALGVELIGSGAKGAADYAKMGGRF